MSEPTTFEIVIRGRASARLLRPLLDDFTFQHPADGNTRLVGVVRDAAHLHGVVAHLTSVNVELISIVAADRPVVEHSLPGCISTLHERSTHS
jgi:hypothetical protein